MKIAFVTERDIMKGDDISGVHNSLINTFKSLGHDVIVLSGFKRTKRSNFSFLRWYERYYRYWGYKYGKYNGHTEPKDLKYIAAQIKKLLEKIDYDIVFCPFGYAISYLKINKPIITWSDATFDNLINYNPSFMNLNKRSIRNYRKCQKRIYSNSDLLIFTTEWAAEKAINFDNKLKKKIKIIEVGSNFNEEDHKSFNDIGKYRGIESTIEFLFVGNNFEAKGGLVAVELVQFLNKNNIKSRLHVVTRNYNTMPSTSPEIILYGGLDRNNKKDYSKFLSLFKTCNFLLLPTLYDCSPHVIAEANGFAMPVIAVNTGGISHMIENGINGYVFNKDDFIIKSYEMILKIISDSSLYMELRKNSYKTYQNRFSWERNYKRLFDDLETILNHPIS